MKVTARDASVANQVANRRRAACAGRLLPALLPPDIYGSSQLHTPLYIPDAGLRIYEARS